MTRSIVFGLSASALLLSAGAAAQGVDPAPVVEVGFRVGVGSPGPADATRWTATGLRLTANINPRTAIEAAFDWDLDREDGRTRDLVSVQVKQALHDFGRGRVFATGGVVWHRRTYQYPAEPGYSRLLSRVVRVGPHFGVGTEVEVTRWASVRGDLQFLLVDDGFLRASVALAVPIGRYPDRAALDAPRAVTGGGPLEHVRSGQRVWVSRSGGDVIEGDVVSWSAAALTIQRGRAVTSVAIGDIRKIETTDRIRDGVGIGAAAGGLAGGVFGGLLGAGLCERSGGCVAEGALIFGGVGVGVGALVGAVADSLRIGRRTLYRAPGGLGETTMVIAPVIVGRGAGAAGVIRW